MQLEIISPEAILFEGTIDSITLPGIVGEFEILSNHAQLISTLTQGTVKIKGDIKPNETFKQKISEEKSSNTSNFTINSGTIEVNNNKVILIIE